MAIHGGGIEPGTSQLTKALAGTEFNYYCYLQPRPTTRLAVRANPSTTLKPFDLYQKA